MNSKIKDNGKYDRQNPLDFNYELLKPKNEARYRFFLIEYIFIVNHYLC
jgi:hypothetical protein